ncbi:MAG: hypothetical protein JWN76_1958 [Chitinophagaceae bacterium]|nr:hypothetical protein [Chitinophagaceae bacterium]
MASLKKLVYRHIYYPIENIVLKGFQKIAPEKEFVPPNKELIECFNLPPDILERTFITSFCNPNVPPSVPLYQKKVFDLFDLPLVQEISGKRHPEFMEELLRSTDKEFVLFFDIDAVPLRKEAVFLLLSDLVNGFAMSGALQTASHLNNGKNNYVGPFFMGVQTAFYKSIGSPSLRENADCDVATILTQLAVEKKIPYQYWVPTEIEIKKWLLYRVGYFGVGCVYNGLVYHSFEIRNGNHYRFVNKCKSILKKFDKDLQPLLSPKKRLKFLK